MKSFPTKWKNFNARILPQFILLFLLLKFSGICSQKVSFSDHYYESKRNLSNAQQTYPQSWPNQSNTRDNGNYPTTSREREYDRTTDNRYSNNYDPRNNRPYGNQSFNNQQGKYVKDDDYERRNYPDQSINWLSPNPFAPTPSKDTVSNTNNDRRGDYGQMPPQRNPPYRSNTSDNNNYGTRNYNTNGSFDDGRNYNKNPRNPQDSSRDPYKNPNIQPYNDRDRQQPMSARDKYYSGENVDSRNRYRENESTRGRDYSGQGQRPFSNMNVHPDLQNRNMNQSQLPILPEVNERNFQPDSRDPKRYENNNRGSGYPDVGPDSKYRDEHNPLRDNLGSNYNSNRGTNQYPNNYPVTRGNYPYSNPGYGNQGPRTYPGPVNPYPGRNNFNPGDPNRNVWNEFWTTTTYRPTAPGVLGRWRPELQGQQRPEDINTVPEIVYVQTSYGKVQVNYGFVVS